MLTFKEALDFVSKELNISNAEEKLREQRLGFLEEYVLRFHQCIPFQNVSALARKVEERDPPTPKEILEDCGSGVGGLCYSLSYFNFWVLQALGFESHLILCTWILAKTERFIHLSVIAEKVEKEDDQYFVEVGTSYPTLAPVPLHDLPQEYTDIFVKYKFVREGNTVRRYHFQKDSKTDSKWVLLSEFDIEQRSDEYIRWCLEPVYTQPGYASMFYLTDLRITLYPEGSALTLSGNVLKVWKKDSNQLNVFEFKDVHELKDAIKTYFPMLSSIVCEKALSCVKFGEDSANPENKSKTK